MCNQINRTNLVISGALDAARGALDQVVVIDNLSEVKGLTKEEKQELWMMADRMLEISRRCAKEA